MTGEFERRAGEAAADWLARLEAVPADALPIAGKVAWGAALDEARRKAGEGALGDVAEPSR